MGAGLLVTSGLGQWDVRQVFHDNQLGMVKRLQAFTHRVFPIVGNLIMCLTCCNCDTSDHFCIHMCSWDAVPQFQHIKPYDSPFYQNSVLFVCYILPTSWYRDSLVADFAESWLYIGVNGNTILLSDLPTIESFYQIVNNRHKKPIAWPYNKA